MKFRINLILLLFGFAIITSCDLQEKPHGFYSEDNFFQTAEDAESGLMYAYDALTFLEYSRGIFWLGEAPSEAVSVKADEGPDVVSLSQWQIDGYPTNSVLENYFQYAYIAINRSNAVIEQVPQGDFDQSLKDKYLGEAYFLRAFNYFNLVRHFGNVPIHESTVSTVSDTEASMSADIDEVYDLIISDLEQAINLLSIDPMLGRADKVAAQSLLAKVYITIASAKENDVPLYTDMEKDVDQMYSNAAQYSGEVVNNQSAYGFDDDLMNIYDIENPRGPEHIFLMSMDRTGEVEGDYSKIGKLFIPYIDGATIYLENNDGTYTPSHDGFSSLQTNSSFYNSFEDDDRRKTDLMVDSVYNENGQLTAEYPGSILYPFTRKYIDPNFIGDKESTKPYLIRYTDVALIYAEAVGPTTEGYQTVNYVRNRAGLGNLQPGLGTDEFRRAIIQERAYELAFEGNRMFDLKRYNLVNDIVPAASNLSDEEVTFYPIPQTELDLNEGI